jgi:hypothetical protein
MNIFGASHALIEIEERAKACGLAENQVILFYMWLSDDRFPGHTFDDAFIKKALTDMKSLMKEFDEWAHKEAMESLRNKQAPW